MKLRRRCCRTFTRDGYWHTSGSQILDSNNQPVRIAGVNWYGFETTDHLVHGLWAQDYRSILSTIKSLGFNVVRKSALQDLDAIVSYAGSIGLRVILDNHRSEAGNSNEASGLWYTSAYPQSSWLADWQTMASRYSDPKFTFNGNATVVGMDLRNEPHLSGSSATSGSCWTGDTAVNGCPRSLTSQNWPVASTASLDAVWSKYWGYISAAGTAPVWLGEFGSTNTATDIQSTAAGSQGQWFAALVSYLKSYPAIGWTYWALNGMLLQSIQ